MSVRLDRFQLSVVDSPQNAAPAKRSRFLFGLQTTVGASGATFLVPASPPSRATGS